MTTRHFWLCRDGAKHFPFAIFQQRPTWEHPVGTTGRWQTGDIAFRINLTSDQTVILFGAWVLEMQSGAVVRVATQVERDSA